MPGMTQPSVTPALAGAIVPHPLVVSTDTPIQEAIASMQRTRPPQPSPTMTMTMTMTMTDTAVHQRARASCVVVTRQGQVVGLINEGTVVATYAQGADIGHQPVGTIMMSPAPIVRSTDTMEAVQQRMIHGGLQEAVVLTPTGDMVGIVTLRTLVRGLNQSLLPLDCPQPHQADTELETYYGVLMQVARHEPLDQILPNLLEAAECHLAGGIGSILLLNQDNHLHLAAGPNLPPPLAQICRQGVPIGPATGACGTAAFRRETVICSNIDTDPLWHDYKELAIGNGLYACWSQPILSSQTGQVLGTFAIYYGEPRSPQARELELMRKMASIIEIAISQYQAERQLKDIQENYLSIYNQASAGVVIANQGGLLVDVNPQFCQMLGYARKELLGQSVLVVTHPDDQPRLHDIGPQVFANGQTSCFQEKRYVRKDGSVFWGSVEVIGVMDAAKNFKHFLAIVHDITSRKQTEQRLQEREALFRAIFNNTFQFIGLLALDGTVLEVNQTSLDATGLTRDEVLGRPFWDTRWWQRSADTQAQLKWAIAQAAQGQFVRYEVEVEGVDHRTINLDFSLRPLRDEHGIVTLLIPEGRDCTEAKRLEAEREHLLDQLRTSEQQLQNLVAGTAATGDDFFPALVHHMAEALNTPYSCVVELKGGTLYPISLSGQGSFRHDPVPYAPRHTPCERVLREGEYYCRNNLQSQFPHIQRFADMGAESYVGVSLQDRKGNAIGVLHILDADGFSDPDFALQILRVFAARAGAELERRRATADLEQLNTKLEQRVAQRTAALQERETRYRTVMDCANDMIVLMDIRGNIVETNPSVSSGLGYTRDELMTMHLSDLYGPDDNPDLTGMLNSVRQGLLSSTPIDVGFRRKDGASVPTSAVLDLVELSDQTLIQGTFRDIGDRKRAEQQLLRQANRERFLAGITQRMCASLNLSDVLESTVEDLHQVLHTSGVLVYRIYPDLAGEVVAQTDGALNSLYPIARQPFTTQQPSTNRQNPTERDTSVKRQQEQLRRRLLTPEAYHAYLRGDLLVRSVSAAEQNQDVHAHEGSGSRDLEALPPAHRRPYHDPLNSLGQWSDRPDGAEMVAPILQGGRLWGLLRVHHDDGPRGWQDWEMSLMRQTASQLAIAIQQASLFEQLQQELSERQQTQIQLLERNQQLAQANEELARATRLKDEFLATMSHELRTPLNAILGNTEALQDEIYGSVTPPQHHALQTIATSGNHLLELISDILNLARIESGKVQLKRHPTQIQELCQTSLLLVKQQAAQKNLRLTVTVDPRLPNLNVDARRISQVMINLLSNAVKFTPDNGSITIQVTRQMMAQPAENASFLPSTPPSWICFSVTDTGIGIAPADMDKLFKPFSQVDGALNRKYEGTGLGLVLVKRIVEMHQGKVGVSSRVGLGSQFWFSLPYQASPPISPSLTQSALSLGDRGSSVDPAPCRILVAEDNAMNEAMMTNFLEAKGYATTVAHNGKEAIALAQSDRPDIVLMDVQMPVMDGLEAIRQIRQIPELEQLPIIALTALAMDGDRQRCLDAGATDYFSKPIKIKPLLALIQTLVYA